MLGQLTLTRPRISDRSFSKPGKFRRLAYFVLASFGSDFYLYLAYPVWTTCILSVGKARTVLCIEGQFFQGENKLFVQCLWYPKFCQEQIGAARSNPVSCQQNPELFKCHIL